MQSSSCPHPLSFMRVCPFLYVLLNLRIVQLLHLDYKKSGFAYIATTRPLKDGKT